MALLDCVNRGPEELEGGEDDRRGWRVLVGNGIVLGYNYGVIRRTPPSRI
jgi:hypothetical protein